MIRKQSLRIALVSVLAVAALSTIGGPSQSVVAQSGDPAATDPAVTASPEVAPEATSASTDQPDTEAKPAAADMIIWTTPDGTTTLKPNTNNLVTVRVTATTGNGPFDPASAQTQLVINGVAQPPQAASATPVGNNFTLDLTANVAAAPNGSSIVFLVNEVGGGPAGSQLYGISRSTIAYLPFAVKNSGTSTIPRIINNTGTSACNAVQNGTAGPLGAFVNYSVASTRVDSWFYIVNPIPAASIVVSLTNYTSVQGQLQVWFEQFGCTQLQPQPAVFGANPNPRLTIGNAPVGNIYFRVISASGQPAPPPYNISWAYGSGIGPFEPNNNPCQATPLVPGTTLTTFVDDQYDFYSMNIGSATNIQVLVQGITVGGAQVQVRTQLLNNNCDPINSTSLIPPFGVVPSGGGDVLLGSVPINASTPPPPPGTYFIRISLPNGITPPGTSYRISWNTTGQNTGTTAGPIFTTNPNQPPSCNPAVANSGCQGDIATNVVVNGSVTYYWFGLQNIPGGYDTLQMQVIAVTNLQGCGAGNPGAVNPIGYANNFANINTTVPNGSFVFTFNQIGGYNIGFRALRQGQIVFSDAKPLKVGCGFQTATFLDLEGKEAPYATQSLLDLPERPMAVFYEDTPNPARPHP